MVFHRNRHRTRRAFTLIELLLVIAIIGVLSSIVLLSVNPSRQLAAARDARRSADITTLLNAIYQYSIDNGGRFPDAMSGTTLAANVPVPICKGDFYRGDTIGVATCPSSPSSAVSLRVITGTYIASIPVDPLNSSTSTGWTKYYVMKLSNGRIQVSATKEVPAGTQMTVTK